MSHWLASSMTTRSKYPGSSGMLPRAESDVTAQQEKKDVTLDCSSRAFCLTDQCTRLASGPLISWTDVPRSAASLRCVALSRVGASCTQSFHNCAEFSLTSP